jgi:hypothetical protein
MPMFRRNILSPFLGLKNSIIIINLNILSVQLVEKIGLVQHVKVYALRPVVAAKE